MELHLIELKRAWLRVKGADAQRFLNGMWTCDFKRSSEITRESGVPTSGGGLFLSAKGKTIVEGVFLVESPTSFLFSLPPEQVEATRAALDHYLVADDVELETPAEPPFDRVYAVPQSTLLPDLAALKTPAPAPNALDQVFKTVLEPWGLRVPRHQISSTHEELWVRPGASLPFATTTLSLPEFDRLRIDAGIPQWGVDFAADSLSLEFPLFHEIAFFKGCYIGQEVIARATYRGHMTRAFSRFSGAGLELGYLYARSEPERPVGKITTAVNGRGLGLVRHSAVESGGGLFQKLASGVEVVIDQVTSLLPEKPVG